MEIIFVIICFMVVAAIDEYDAKAQQAPEQANPRTEPSLFAPGWTEADQQLLDELEAHLTPKEREEAATLREQELFA
jgi:hypothetical protein